MSDIQHKSAFEAITEKGKEFIFIIQPQNWLHRLLQKFKLTPSSRTLVVKPMRFGVRGICATYINKATFDKYSENTVFKAASLFSEYELENVIMFLAYVLWNRESTPPKWLIEGIRAKDQSGIDEILDFAMVSLNTQAFLNSIISMTGVSLQPEEIIAPESESRASTK